MEHTAKEAKSVVESIAITVRLSAKKRECDDVFGVPMPRLAYLKEGDGGKTLETCLSAYWRTPGRSEGSILDRLHNATVLLSQADQMGSDPIALSLSFAAIEALVCEKDELPVNKQIKRHVATLLVQEPTNGQPIDAGSPDFALALTKKRERKGSVISKFYTIRCQIMHGNNVEAPALAAVMVRRIAAGVVRNVVCWRWNQMAAGGEESWKHLMNELNIATRTQSIVVGVPDLSELIPDKWPTEPPSWANSI
jgi:hypothetical protein